MAYTVAQAEVTVLPDARGFGNELRRQVSAEADRAGREAGDKIAEGIRERLRVGLADLPDAKIGLDTARADAELDKFLAETKAKTEAAGTDSGRKMGDNLAKAAVEGSRSGSPLIVAAIAGGIIAGGPLIAAAGGSLMVGLAAVLEHNQPEVQKAAAGVGKAFADSFGYAGQVTIPYLVRALDTVRDSARGLAETAAPAFQALEWPIQSVTQGVISLAQNALPGLVRVVQTGTPVFAGLEKLLASIGTGLGSMFTTLSQHAAANGTVLAALGSALDALLNSLGTLMGAGAELGSVILPPLAVVLHALADVLQVIAPVLPSVALGFAAWKVVGLLAPMLGSLAGQLDTIGIKALIAADELTLSQAAGDAAAAGFGAAATGARGLEAAMGPIGWIMAGIGLAIPLLISHFSDQDGVQKKVKASADAMRQALQESKGAIDINVRATAAKQAQDTGLLDQAKRWGVDYATVIDAILGNADALDQVTAAGKRYEAGLDANTSAGYRAQGAQDQYSTSAGNAALANDKAKTSSQEHRKALDDLSGATNTEVRNQQQLAGAIDGSTSATDRNVERLQGLSNTASAAQTQINLLKGALDALTGKAVTLDQAEIAVTQSVDAVTQAVTNKTAALAFNNGQLDLSNTKSAQASSLLINLAGSQKQVIATMEQQGASMTDINKTADDQRAAFIKVAQQLGATAGEAQDLANRYYGIPKDVHTEITANTNPAVAQIDALTRKLATLTNGSYYANVYVTESGQHTVGKGFNARGNIVHAYADGGLEPNMAGGLAQIVAPQTWRVIGDRVTDDEAYIPINNSARSLAILAQTAGRMGLGLTAPAAGGGGKTDARSYVFNIGGGQPQSIVRQIRDAQLDLEFLHG